MEPYGNGNPKPLMCITGALLESITPIGGGKHLRMKLRRGRQLFDAVFFGHTLTQTGLHSGDRVDVAFTPQINRYRDQKSVQLLVTDIRLTDDAPICRRILSGMNPAPMEVPELAPSRKELGHVWRTLEKANRPITFTVSGLAERTPITLVPGKICACLRIFQEVGLIRLTEDADCYTVEILPHQGKADLSKSALLRYLSHR